MKIYSDKINKKEKDKLFLNTYLSLEFAKYFVFDEPSYNEFIKSKSEENISKESYYHFSPIGEIRVGSRNLELFWTHEYPFSDILYTKKDYIDNIFISTTQIPLKYTNDFNECLSLANLDDLEKFKREIKITNNELVVFRSGINVFDNFLVNKFKVKNGTYQISHIFDRSWVENIAEEVNMIKIEKELESSGGENFYEDAWEARKDWHPQDPNLHFICIKNKDNSK